MCVYMCLCRMFAWMADLRWYAMLVHGHALLKEFGDPIRKELCKLR